MDERNPTYAFGMEFTHIPEDVSQDLETLERECAVYTDHWINEVGDFRHVRIAFTPEERQEFCRRSWAYELFLRYDSAEWAVEVPGIDQQVAIEADSYSITFPDGSKISPPYHCFAAFLGTHLEALVCGSSDRQTVIELDGREKLLFEVRRTIETLTPTIRSFNNRGKNLASWEITCELDVRDLLYVMLRPRVFDITKEEIIPSKAGTYNFVDLYSAAIRLLIELKWISPRRKWKTILNEIYADIQAYAAHPNCDDLLFVIVDSVRGIQDPRQIETDLSRLQVIDGREIKIRVIVCEP